MQRTEHSTKLLILEISVSKGRLNQVSRVPVRQIGITLPKKGLFIKLSHLDKV